MFEKMAKFHEIQIFRTPHFKQTSVLNEFVKIWEFTLFMIFVIYPQKMTI